VSSPTPRKRTVKIDTMMKGASVPEPKLLISDPQNEHQEFRILIRVLDPGPSVNYKWREKKVVNFGYYEYTNGLKSSSF